MRQTKVDNMIIGTEIHETFVRLNESILDNTCLLAEQKPILQEYGYIIDELEALADKVSKLPENEQRAALRVTEVIGLKQAGVLDYKKYFVDVKVNKESGTEYCRRYANLDALYKYINEVARKASSVAGQIRYYESHLKAMSARRQEIVNEYGDEPVALSEPELGPELGQKVSSFVKDSFMNIVGFAAILTQIGLWILVILLIATTFVFPPMILGVAITALLIAILSTVIKDYDLDKIR